ncbi:MAG: type II secretion system protein [Candidatus Margulisiibacteriota bacterium]
MKKNGFTLLELIIVTLVTATIMVVMFSLFNVVMNRLSTGYIENQLQIDLLNSLYQIEDDARAAEKAYAVNDRYLVIENRFTSVPVTISYFLRPDPPNYQLWAMKNAADEQISYPLCTGIVSANTLFRVDNGFVMVTMNAASITNNTLKEPFTITVSIKVRLRNSHYAK